MRITSKLKFDELSILAEAATPGKSYYAPTAPVAPAVAPVTPGSRVAAAAGAPLKALAGGLGKFVAGSLRNPQQMANNIRGARQGGIMPMLASAVDAVKAAYGNIRDKQLKAYYDKLDFPAGWPQKGSKFSIQTTDGKTYIGTVASLSNVGERIVLNVPTSMMGGGYTGNAPRLYVIEMDPKERAYFSIRRVTVSDLGTNPTGAAAGAGTTIPGGRNVPSATYIKNEAESGLASHFVTHYDTTSQSFIMNLNKTYTCHIAITPTTQGLEKGAKITGKDIITGKDVTGVIVTPTKIKLDNGTEINVYQVEANATM